MHVAMVFYGYKKCFKHVTSLPDLG